MDKYMHDLDSIQDIVFVNTVGGNSWFLFKISIFRTTKYYFQGNLFYYQNPDSVAKKIPI